jgi:hypothetical protein
MRGSKTIRKHSPARPSKNPADWSTALTRPVKIRRGPTFKTCVYRKLDSAIMVVKAAEDNHRRAGIGACFLMMTHARLRRSPSSASNSARPCVMVRPSGRGRAPPAASTAATGRVPQSDTPRRVTRSRACADQRSRRAEGQGDHDSAVSDICRQSDQFNRKTGSPALAPG